VQASHGHLPPAYRGIIVTLMLPISAWIGLTGLLLFLAGLVLVRSSGARTRMGRRLAGPPQLAVGDLFDLAQLPARPIRVIGRIRCPDPIVTSRDEQLVAVHRDVEVLLPDGRWRSIERVRATRGFELWDHAGSLPLDAAQAAEPLISIPYVWEGDPAELDESYAPAIERLRMEHGAPRRARAVTRTISVVDRILVLARPEREPDGTLRLVPPDSGFVISSLDLPDAMRLLGGPRRGLLLAGAGMTAAGVLCILVAGFVAALGLVAG